MLFGELMTVVQEQLPIIAVSENIRVSEGDLLFQLDPLPYQLAVAQAEADLQLAEAQRSTAARVLVRFPLHIILRVEPALASISRRWSTIACVGAIVCAQFGGPAS
jgi:multidrug efflux pump subunit AcrA (membrane-fusion protein)